MCSLSVRPSEIDNKEQYVLDFIDNQAIFFIILKSFKLYEMQQML